MFAVAAIAIAAAIGLVAITAVGRSLSTESRVRRQSTVDALAVSGSEEVFGRLAQSVDELSVVTAHPGYGTGSDVDTDVWVRFSDDGQVVDCTKASEACFTVRLDANPRDLRVATSAIIQVTARQCRGDNSSTSSCVFARRQTTLRKRLFTDHVIWVNSATNAKFVSGDIIAGPVRLNAADGLLAYCGAPEVGIDTAQVIAAQYRVETLGSAVIAPAAGCTSAAVPTMSTSLVGGADAMSLPVVSAAAYAAIAGGMTAATTEAPAVIQLNGSGTGYSMNGAVTSFPTNGVIVVDGPVLLSSTAEFSGNLTIVATGDITITSDLQLNSQIIDMLGVVSTGGNINIEYDDSSRIIEALLLAPSLVSGTGIVQATNVSGCAGDTCTRAALVIYGAIVARELGTMAEVATTTGAIQRGFSKAFSYDERFARAQPPFAISQTRGLWMRLGMSTVSPLTPGVSGVAPTTTIAFDPTSPTAQFASPTSPSLSTTLSYVVTFSERVSGVSAEDFSVTGTATGCTISRSSSFGVSITVTVVCTSTGTVVLALSAGAVIDADGNAVASATASTVVIGSVPGAPTSVVGTAGSNQVVLTWSAPASDGGAAITDYVVQYATSLGGAYTTFTDAVSTALSATVTGLASGSTYYFKVAAVNAVGTGEYSSASSGVPLAVTCATGGVCVLGEVGPGGGKVFYVSASAFASPGSTCNTAGVGGISACRYLEAAPTTGSSAWTDVNRRWNTNFNTLITGADGTAIGTGYQNTLDMIAQTGTVAATSAAATAQAFRGPNNLSDWFLPSRNELIQLRLNKGRVGGIFDNQSYWSSSETSNISATGIIFDNSGTEFNGNKNTPYYVRPVRAFGWPVPSAPTSVVGTAGSNQVSLTWSAPASDGGAAITDYVVQYATSAGGAYTTFTDAVSTALSATVTGLTSGNTYYFKVAAVNAAGTGAYSSASSGVIFGLYVRGYNISGTSPTRTDDLPLACTAVWADINLLNNTIPARTGCRNYSVMLHVTGSITVPVTSAQFRVGSDDGGSVQIGATNFEYWGERGCSYTNSSQMTFTAGQTLALDAWFYENGGSECFILQWNIGAGFVNVPASAFSS